MIALPHEHELVRGGLQRKFASLLRLVYKTAHILVSSNAVINCCPSGNTNYDLVPHESTVREHQQVISPATRLRSVHKIYSILI